MDLRTYTQLERTPCPKTGKRLYKTPAGTVPSVTTILDATKSEDTKQSLQRWRDRIGNKEADRITNESAKVGEIFHEHMENYLLNKPRRPGNNLIHKICNELADVVIEKGLSKVDETWGIEAPVYFPNLYAGTCDFVGVVDGIACIGDFKNTRKPKKEEYIEDYYQQLVAYALAHNETYGTEIKDGMIWMVSREDPYRGEYQYFHLTGDKWVFYKNKWLDRVAQYYQLN